MQHIPVQSVLLPNRRGFVQIAAAVAVAALVATAAWFWLRSDRSNGTNANVATTSATTTPSKVTAELGRERNVTLSLNASHSGKSPTKSPKLPKSDTTMVSQSSGEEPKLSDNRLRELIVGRWEIERTGLRRLEVRDDGTATMTVTLPEIWQLVFGEKLTFDIEWTIEDGVLTYETVGGEPKDKFDTITKIYGRVRKQAVMDMTAERMLLEDDEDGPPHDWKRIAGQ